MNIWAKLAPYSSIQYVGNTRKMFLWSNIINLKMTPRTLRKMLTKQNRDQKILAKWNIQQYWFLPCHICFWISPINSSLQPLSSWCRRRWWSNITSRWSSCPGRRRPTSIGSRRRWRRIVPVVPITSILLSSTSPWRLDLLWHQRLVLHVPNCFHLDLVPSFHQEGEEAELHEAGSDLKMFPALQTDLHHLIQHLVEPFPLSQEVHLPTPPWRTNTPDQSCYCLVPETGLKTVQSPHQASAVYNPRQYDPRPHRRYRPHCWSHWPCPDTARSCGQQLRNGPSSHYQCSVQ